MSAAGLRLSPVSLPVTPRAQPQLRNEPPRRPARRRTSTPATRVRTTNSPALIGDTCGSASQGPSTLARARREHAPASGQPHKDPPETPSPAGRRCERAPRLAPWPRAAADGGHRWGVSAPPLGKPRTPQKRRESANAPTQRRRPQASTGANNHQLWHRVASFIRAAAKHWIGYLHAHHPQRCAARRLFPGCDVGSSDAFPKSLNAMSSDSAAYFRHSKAAIHTLIPGHATRTTTHASGPMAPQEAFGTPSTLR